MHTRTFPQIYRLCSLSFSPALTVQLLRRTPRRTPFYPCAVLPRPASLTHPLPATPFQCPRSRTATLGEEAAATYLPLRWPDCTLSRLSAEEYDRPVTQSIVTPKPSSRTPARALSVSPHSGADGLVQAELPAHLT